jgi:hypothetical protein
MYSGETLGSAIEYFAEYTAQSKAAYGRAAGEPVTLTVNGKPEQEYTGDACITVSLRISRKNESTRAPYWMVHDLSRLPDDFMRLSTGSKAMVMYDVSAGPFFSREEAEGYVNQNYCDDGFLREQVVISCPCAPEGCQYSRKVRF